MSRVPDFRRSAVIALMRREVKTELMILQICHDKPIRGNVVRENELHNINTMVEPFMASIHRL